MNHTGFSSLGIKAGCPWGGQALQVLSSSKVKTLGMGMSNVRARTDSEAALGRLTKIQHQVMQKGNNRDVQLLKAWSGKINNTD